MSDCTDAPHNDDDLDDCGIGGVSMVVHKRKARSSRATAKEAIYSCMKNRSRESEDSFFRGSRGERDTGFSSDFNGRPKEVMKEVMHFLLLVILER